ncbi:MAG: 50S ribosomal protein L13 [Candidatus Pacebacteria bacterium]|nr:50S ribosomal protein L13 [Candidatus Paceibacterota bacterium]
MTNTNTTKEYILDAEGQALGRLSSEAAAILNGKKSIDFAKNEVNDVKVKILNASKIKLTGNKLKEGIHKTYSGYPGGQKIKTFVQVVERKGYKEIIKHAIYGMLPKNKLQDKKMKNLSIEE